MKKLIITLAALTALVATAAEQKKPKMTPQERRERIYRHTGGMVTRQATGKTFKIVNAAGVQKATVERIAADVKSAVSFPVEVVEGAADPKQALDDKTGFALLFVKDNGPRILTAPEDGWAQVNVATLATDDTKVLDARIRKEGWRAMVYGLGGGNTKFQACIMKPMIRNADLDANRMLMACPEVFAPISETAGKFGIKPNRPTTYLRACQEGWAPAPTNDVQKAIWDKVHAMPTEPIKIVPETKKTDK